MQFLRETTLEAIVNQTVTVVIRSNEELLQTITARTFLSDGNLLIDCAPALPEKYTVAVPDDAIISSADRPDKSWKYGIFLHPNSEAAKFIMALVAAKTISNN